MLVLVAERGRNDRKRQIPVWIRPAKTPESSPSAKAVTTEPGTPLVVYHERKHRLALAVARRAVDLRPRGGNPLQHLRRKPVRRRA